MDQNDPLRTQSHSELGLVLGDMGVQIGALTPVFFAFRDRARINQIEEVTGGRFHPNFDRIGGLKDDIPKGWVEESAQWKNEDVL